MHVFRKAAARSATPTIMSVTFADAGETVRRPCLGSEASLFITARPEPAETGSFT
jgi:hypothetical protein